MLCYDVVGVLEVIFAAVSIDVPTNEPIILSYPLPVTRSAPPPAPRTRIFY